MESSKLSLCHDPLCPQIEPACLSSADTKKENKKFSLLLPFYCVKSVVNLLPSPKSLFLLLSLYQFIP